VAFATIDQHLIEALDLVENCYEAYRRAPDDIRRRFNQAFFERVVVDQDTEVTAELAEPFRSLSETAQGLAAAPEIQQKPLSDEPRAANNEHGFGSGF
jgi:hypothetical protein